MNELETLIDQLWEKRDLIKPEADPELRRVVGWALGLLDSGEVRWRTQLIGAIKSTAALGEDLRMTGVVDAGLVQGRLVQREGCDRVEATRQVMRRGGERQVAKSDLCLVNG